MGFRSFRCAILVVIGLAIAALPGLWSDQMPGSSFGPALTWAGGTPDETLNPPPTPPQAMTPPKPKGTAYATDRSGPTELQGKSLSDARGVSWQALWRMLRATLLRI